MHSELFPLLTAIEAGHNWLRPRLRAALETAGPTAVERGTVPLWSWRHSQRMARITDAWRIPQSGRRGRPSSRSPARRADAILSWRRGVRLTGYASELAAGRMDFFDHCGTTTVSGCTLLVAELYVELDELLPLVRHLTRAAGCLVEAVGASAWGHGTSRLVFLPRVSFPPALAIAEVRGDPAPGAEGGARAAR